MSFLEVPRGLFFKARGLEAAILFLGAQRAALQSDVNAAHARVLAQRVTGLTNELTLLRANKEPLGAPWTDLLSSCPWTLASSRVDAEQFAARRNQSQASSVACDVRIALHFIPQSDFALAEVFETRTKVFERLAQAEGVREFSFDSNAASPGADHAVREKLWTLAKTPGNSFTLSMDWEPGSPDGPGAIEALYDAVPVRAQRLARTRMTAQFLSAMQTAHPHVEPSTLRKKAVALLGTPASQLARRVAEETARLSEVLPGPKRLSACATQPLSRLLQGAPA
jgi:hypothetical protein